MSGSGPAAPIVEKVTAAFLRATASSTATLSELSPYASPAHVATLYAPTTPPVLTALTPTPAESAGACAVPSGS